MTLRTAPPRRLKRSASPARKAPKASRPPPFRPVQLATLVDGEAVVLDAEGRSNFQSLQRALKSAPDTIDYIAFDLLEQGGEDLTGLPLLERKARLAKILAAPGKRIRYS